MSSRNEHIKKILEVYIHRGELVLRMLEKGESGEKIDDILKWRKASFHNFVALDHEHSKIDANYLQRDEFQSLWKEIQRVDAQLTSAIEKEKQELASQLTKLSKSKKLVSKFHSKSQKGTSFIGSI